MLSSNSTDAAFCWAVTMASGSQSTAITMSATKAADMLNMPVPQPKSRQLLLLLCCGEDDDSPKSPLSHAIQTTLAAKWGLVGYCSKVT